MRLVPMLTYVAIAFAVLDFLSTITSTPGCGRVANLLWFIPDLRPLTSAWINWVVGVFSVVFTYAVLAFVGLFVMSRLTGGLFSGHIVAGLVNTVLGKMIVVVLVAWILHSLVQVTVAALC